MGKQLCYEYLTRASLFTVYFFFPHMYIYLLKPFLKHITQNQTRFEINTSGGKIIISQEDYKPILNIIIPLSQKNSICQTNVISKFFIRLLCDQ